MQAHRNAAFDAVIHTEMARYISTRGNFTKRELVNAVMRHPDVQAQVRRVKARGNDLGFDVLMERGIADRVTDLLHKKDALGIRKFESYNPGGGEPPVWFEMASVDKKIMRLLIHKADRRERSMQLRKKIYILLYERLEHAKEGATVRDIYENAKGVIAQFLKTNKVA